MGNYLRIYKDLDEFKSNAFNLPYPCVSVVDDDTIETDENIVEFEQLDKLSFKVEVPLENASTECVNVASFSNPISVEGYSINGGDAVFIDLPQLIDTTQEIDWVYQNIDGNDMYAPSYDNHMQISDLNSDLKIKTNRPINEDDFFFMTLGLDGQVAMGEPIPITELNGALIMEEPTVYKLNSEFLAYLKNELGSQFPGAVICFSFIDNGYFDSKGQTKPSITTSVGALKYETELKETKVEFVLTEVSGSSMYLPSDNYLFDVFSINIDTRIKISRALVETDYVLLMTTFDEQTDVQLVPSSEMLTYGLLKAYSETEFGFSQEFIDSMASSDVPSDYKIGLYFVDKGYFDSELQTIPTIDNYVMAEVTVGGLTNLCVPSEEIPSDGVVEVRMKATNDLNNISFVNKQNLKSFDGSRYGLNNIKEISSKQFESCNKLEEFIIPNGVETVGDFAFNNCFSLSSVTIPESVTEIGAKAFRKCMFLSENFINQSSLDAEANNYWKANVYDVIQEDGLCIRGTSVWGCRPNSSGVTIPDYITRIEENAFIGCTNLKRVDMPNSIKYIGKNAFRYCINVENIVIPESVEEIASDAFTYCFFDLDVFENKSNINAKENNYWQAVICKDNCVSSCGILLYIDGENVIIHDGIKVINADAIRNRESIKSIIIPNSVTSIDNYAFSGCTSLTTVTIGSSVTSIGDEAFYNCSGLTSVMIPDTVTSIGTSAFGCCYFQRDNFIYNGQCDAEFNNWWGATIYDVIQEDGLCISGTTAVKCRPNATNVTIPNSVTNIGDYAFYNCSGLTSIVIPDSVTSIGNYAFRYCSSLTSVTIPSSVTSIGYGAFRNCISLTSVTIPSSVTSVSDNTFRDCTSLAAIDLQNGIINIKRRAFQNCTSLTSVVIPDSVTTIGNYAFSVCSSLTSVTIPDSVASIGRFAFRDCISLTSIEIPDSVTEIGNGVFYGCTSLTSIPICHGVNKIGMWAFQDCTSLTSVTIPDNITYVNNRAFYKCTSLTSIEIPNSVTIIGASAFNGCRSLTSVTIPDSVTKIDDNAFQNCRSLTSIEIPNSVTKIDKNAFDNCRSLTSVTIPDSVTYIDEYAFRSCSSLTSVTIPSSVKTISSYAFSYCRSLSSITIPDSVTTIGSYVFYDCYFERDKFINNSSATGYPWRATICDVIQEDGLCISGTTAIKCRLNATNVTIPSSVTSIGTSAFSGCTSLTSVIIPSSVTSIGTSAFTSCYFQRDKFINNSNLTSSNNWGATLYDVIQEDGLCISGTTAVKCRPKATNIIIPNSVTSIGDKAFSGCTSLTSVIIPSSITSIGGYAFSGCTSLSSVTILDGVTSISNYAFNSCGGLTSIVIPSSVTSIGQDAFYGCDSLSSITIPDSVTSIGNSAFYGCDSLTSVTIPSSVTSIGGGAFNFTPFENNLPNGEIYLGSCYYKYNGTMPSNTSITIKDGTKSISYSAFRGCSGLTSIVIPDSVTKIDNYAFENCTSLSSITIPDSVTSIGYNAFNGCYFERDKFINNSSASGYPWSANICDIIQEDGLCISGTTAVKCRLNATNVTIPDSVTSIGDSAFYNCTSLSSVTIPDSVTSIDNDAFYGCDSLTSVTIPDSVTSIGRFAFRDCTSLTSIVIPDSVTSIGYNAFNGCYFERDKFINNSSASGYPWSAELYDIIQDDGLYISETRAIKCRQNATNVTIPSGVTSIGAGAFSGCTSLTSIEIQDGVIEIGYSAFTNCISLSSVTIPDSVTSISDYAFRGCTSLKSVIIPSSVTSIGSSAFNLCRSLTSVTIPDSVTSIGVYAFDGCSCLTSVTIGSGVTSIGNEAFSDCRTLTSVTILDGVTSIGFSAFTNCINLTSVTIPSSVTSIGGNAFSFCESLSSVTILDGVTSIGYSAFRYCSTLSSVTIPDSVTSIGSNAFEYCSSLTSVTIPSSVTEIGSSAFNGCYFERDKFINNSSVSGYPWGATFYDIIQDDGLCIDGTTAYKCRQNATNVTIPSSVTSIGGHAFEDCIYLTTIEIPSSVTSIGYEAFRYCASLSSVTIPDSVTSISDYAFRNCYFQRDKLVNNSSVNGYPWSATLYDIVQDDGLCISGTTAVNCRLNATNLTIGSGVTSIGYEAFCSRSGLTSVTILDGVTSIGYAAFRDCTSLSSITIPDSVTYIDSNVFSDTPFYNNLPNGEIYLGSCYYLHKGTMSSNPSITIKDGTKSICNYAFSNCSGITSIEIPNSVTKIGDYAFYNCSGLTSVTIPNSVTSIGNNAFYGCTSLNGDIAPNGFEYFGKILYRYVNPNIDNEITNIRYGCVSLSQSCLSGNNYFSMIIIPDTVTSIGSSAFTNCSNLTTIIIPDSVTSIGQEAFYRCTSLTYAEIGDGVTRIPNFTFRKCTSLDKVVIGGGVRSIGDGAFSGCTQLDEVCIKEGLESIEYCAFRDSQLGSITLPSTIKSLDSTCFYNCGFLHEIICNATIAPTVNDSFSGLPTNGTLYVPHGSDYSSWKSLLPSGWVIKYLYEPKECTNLVITANDVHGRQTKAQVSYTATTNGIHPITHEVMNDVIVTGVTKSQSFEQNTSYTDTIEREITFEYLGITASTTITQGVWVEVSYSIDLQNQWRMSSAVPNPDSSLYDGVYESFSNYNVNSSSAACVVTIDGYSDFKFYIRSNGEKNNDYVDVYDLDGSSTIKATTKSIANSGITLSSYTLVEFTNLDGGEHTIKVVYKKDSSSSSGTDRGYLMIPYNQDE